MNDARRKSIREIMDILENVKGDLEMLMEEEEDYRDNMPENLRSGEKYQTSEMDSGYLSEAVDNVFAAIGNLEDIE